VSGGGGQPNPIDRYVGARLRLARRMRNLSQEALAERLGVTFQQVQKYENGVNRLTASRLYQAALLLEVPVSSLFPDLKPEGPQAGLSEPSPPDPVLDWLGTPEGVEVNLAFARIADEKVRRRLIHLIESLAASAD
jgi:transcriptional regulator with XRE-family HTH domain